MNLRNYLNSISRVEQDAFASRCGTTIAYLRKAVSKGQQLGSILCVAIERESHGVVSRQELHPAWHLVWPELVPVSGYSACLSRQYLPDL